MRSQNTYTSILPILGAYTYRKDLWNIKDLPDSQIYCK